MGKFSTFSLKSTEERLAQATAHLQPKPAQALKPRTPTEAGKRLLNANLLRVYSDLKEPDDD